MGRGAASTTLSPTEISLLPPLKRPCRRFANLIPLFRDTPRPPLHHTPTGLSVGAALSTGLLHKLRGAPSQERNAILSHLQSDYAMLATFTGHGAHGVRLCDMAAATAFRTVKKAILPPSAQRTVRTPLQTSCVSSASSTTMSSVSSVNSSTTSQRDGRHSSAVNPERLVDNALTEAYATIARTQWVSNSGISATICVLRRDRLVVGACGLPTVIAVSRRGSKTVLELLTGRAMQQQPEREDGRKALSGLKGAVANVVCGVGGIGSIGSIGDGDGGGCSSATSSSECDYRRESHTPSSYSSWSNGPVLETRFSLPQRKGGMAGAEDNNVYGSCEVPTIRSFDLMARHTHIVVSTMRLWAGDSVFAPQEFADVFSGSPDECVIDLAERLMSVAFGSAGPTHDATILCTRLR